VFRCAHTSHSHMTAYVAVPDAVLSYVIYSIHANEVLSTRQWHTRISERAFRCTILYCLATKGTVLQHVVTAAATCDSGPSTRSKAVVGATPGCALPVEETNCNAKVLLQSFALLRAVPCAIRVAFDDFRHPHD
jgi:hypothetical protein